MTILQWEFAQPLEPFSRSTESDASVLIPVICPTVTNTTDPTSVTPQVQFVTGGLPPRIDLFEGDPADAPPTATGWLTAGWATVNHQIYINIEVGPDGDIQLTPGRWAVWIRIPDGPVVAVGQIRITG